MGTAAMAWLFLTPMPVPAGQRPSRLQYEGRPQPNCHGRKLAALVVQRIGLVALRGAVGERDDVLHDTPNLEKPNRNRRRALPFKALASPTRAQPATPKSCSVTATEATCTTSCCSQPPPHARRHTPTIAAPLSDCCVCHRIRICYSRRGEGFRSPRRW